MQKRHILIPIMLIGNMVIAYILFYISNYEEISLDEI